MEEKNDIKLPINIDKILELIPHRFPFLFIDRIVELEPAKIIKAFKNITYNENIFQGHFINNPVLPGVIIIEAMTQAGAVLAYFTNKKQEVEKNHKNYYILTIDKTKFRHPVIPGDRLFIECSIIQQKDDIIKFKCIAKVDEKIVAESEIMTSIR